MWRHQIYLVISCHLFLDNHQVSSISDKWSVLTKTALYKGQTLVQLEGGDVAPQL